MPGSLSVSYPSSFPGRAEDININKAELGKSCIYRKTMSKSERVEGIKMAGNITEIWFSLSFWSQTNFYGNRYSKLNLRCQILYSSKNNWLIDLFLFLRFTLKQWIHTQFAALCYSFLLLFFLPRAQTHETHIKELVTTKAVCCIAQKTFLSLLQRHQTGCTCVTGNNSPYHQVEVDGIHRSNRDTGRLRTAEIQQRGDGKK